MPIERRWELIVAGMAKRSFRRVSEGQDEDGVRHGFSVVLRYLGMANPPATSTSRAMRGGELQEARGASRGYACRGSKNAASLSLRFGLQSMGLFSLVRVKPRRQNARQSRESSRPHSIAQQFARPNKLAMHGPDPTNRHTEQDARIAGSVKPWLSPQPAKGGGGHG